MLVRALSFFLLFLFLGRGVLGQEISHLQPQNYLQRAQALELWREDMWLRLGHYDKSLLGGLRSPFSGLFFIDINGANDPKAELLATVRAFTEPTANESARYKMLPACFFKARYRWLQSRLNLPNPPPCPERDSWKAQLNATAVTLIFAASDLGTATSSFGHTFLKFSNPENRGGKELLDYGLNYAADADKSEGVLYAVKGLFGFYRGRFSMLPYHQKIREYTNFEGRDLWEYPLRLRADQVDLLVDHLLELEGSSAPYYFLSDNCAYQLMRVLEVADSQISLQKHFSPAVIPIDTVKRLVRETNVVEEGHYRPSLKSEYLEHFRLLPRSQRRNLAFTIENLRLPEDQAITKEQRAILLETAMKYYSLKAFEDKRDLDAEEYKLQVQRARLGYVKVPQQRASPPPPDQSHDSSAVYIGWGEQSHRGFMSLKFRLAFHDLEQNDDGAVKFSRSDIFSPELRYYEDRDQWAFQRMTWLDLLNTSPISPLEHSLSWKARLESVDPLHTEAEGGIGYSFDVFNTKDFRWRVVGLAAAGYQQTHFRAGPNGILIMRLFDRLGISIDGGLYYGKQAKPEVPVLFAADAQLARNWDLRFESREGTDKQIRLIYNFLM